MSVYSKYYNIERYKYLPTAKICFIFFLFPLNLQLPKNAPIFKAREICWDDFYSQSTVLLDFLQNLSLCLIAENVTTCMIKKIKINE